MGSDQSTQLPAGARAVASNHRETRIFPTPLTPLVNPYRGDKESDKDKIAPLLLADSPKSSPRNQGNRPRAATVPNIREPPPKEGTPKHNIVVVADGQNIIKDPDPELTRLNTIPVFYPIMRGSLNLPTSSRDSTDNLLDKLDSKTLLQLCVRYQEHLKQLAESVAFDQNALCIRIKEIDCAVQKIMNTMTEKQRKYAKYAEQFQRTSETVTVLNRVKKSMDDIIPKMEVLNKMLPPDQQLEPFQLKDRGQT